MPGEYQLYLYLDNQEYDREDFEISGDNDETVINDDVDSGTDLTPTQALQFIAALFGEDSQIYQIVSLLIKLGVLD